MALEVALAVTSVVNSKSSWLLEKGCIKLLFNMYALIAEFCTVSSFVVPKVWLRRNIQGTAKTHQRSANTDWLAKHYLLTITMKLTNGRAAKRNNRTVCLSFCARARKVFLEGLKNAKLKSMPTTIDNTGRFM